MVREIITIQLGNYSNYVGTHWWNLQETNFSYDPTKPSLVNHDILYREGENAKKQVTFTPRLLLADLKGTLGYLKEEGSLYEEPIEIPLEQTLLWDEKHLEVKNDEAQTAPDFIQKLDENSEEATASFTDLEDNITSWVDYLVPKFHPRTVNVVKEYQHKSESQPFDVFHCGQNLWNTVKFSEDFCDKVRNYVEECDSLQGFQVLLDSTDGFAGLGTSCVQYLRDEYTKSILAFPVINSVNTDPSIASLVRTVNSILCYEQLYESSSLYSPLCCGEIGWLQPGSARKFSHLTYDAQLKYHSSAILATALDTLTLRYRHKDYPMSSMSDLCSDLNKMGRKAAVTSLSLPFPMEPKKDLIDVLDDLENPPWTSLTPSCEVPKDRSMHSVALRGIPEDRLKRPLQQARKQMQKAAYRCGSVHEMMSLYLSCSCYASATYVMTLEEGLKIKAPYPRIFNNNVHSNGDIAGWPVGEDIISTPVMAGLHSGNSIACMYATLHKEGKRVRDIRKFHAFQDAGMEHDEFMESLHHLMDCKENYEEMYL